jgi:hypothetical protein
MSYKCLTGFLYNSTHKEIFKKENQGNPGSGYVGLTGNYASEQKAKTYSPQVMFRYDYPVTEKISICADLYTRFGFSYSQFKSGYTLLGMRPVGSLVIVGNPYGYMYDSVYVNIFINDTSQHSQIFLGEIESGFYQDIHNIRVGEAVLKTGIV